MRVLELDGKEVFIAVVSFLVVSQVCTTRPGDGTVPGAAEEVRRDVAAVRREGGGGGGVKVGLVGIKGGVQDANRRVVGEPISRRRRYVNIMGE